MALVYSCCFWFSLRLGGIIIGILSFVQGLLVLTACSLAYNHTQQVKDKITYLISNLNLLYAKDYLENIKEALTNGTFRAFFGEKSLMISLKSSSRSKSLSMLWRYSFDRRSCLIIVQSLVFLSKSLLWGPPLNPALTKSINYTMCQMNYYARKSLNDLDILFYEDAQNYITLGISLTCIYMIICLLYIYGAYLRNNILMICFILVELLRLIVLSVLVATSLFVLKQNTMDIGLLIGASVVGGFLLLGMFYLWLCTANLPILINEMQRDEQAATITKLEQLLETNNRRAMLRGLDNIPYSTYSADSNSGNVFISKTHGIPHNKSLIHGSKLSVWN